MILLSAIRPALSMHKFVCHDRHVPHDALRAGKSACYDQTIDSISYYWKPVIPLTNHITDLGTRHPAGCQIPVWDVCGHFQEDPWRRPSSGDISRSGYGL